MSSIKKNEMTDDRIEQLQNLLRRIQINTNQAPFKENSQGLSLVNEALTHTSAKTPINHERLEFLGDAVLRLAASEFIDRSFPEMTVGERSELRSQLVSDQWLTSVGQSISIEKVLIIGGTMGCRNLAGSEL